MGRLGIIKEEKREIVEPKWIVADGCNCEDCQRARREGY